MDLYAVMMSSIPQLFHAAKTAILTPGVYTMHVDYSEYAKGSMSLYNKEWKSWRRSAPQKLKDYSDIERALWTQCCVCKKVTRANHPWYKRVTYIRSPYSFDSAFKPFIEGRWATWVYALIHA